MLKNDTVGIWNKDANTKVNGITIAGELQHIKDIDCDIQPYSTALLMKQYGYDIEVNKRVFTDVDFDIRIGTILYYTNVQNVIEKYLVKAIVPWNTYWEVMVLGI